MENSAPTTNNFLKKVEIKNFKSIKDLRLDCKRVNVFIGKPNVGKSNILEGLGLLGAEYSGEKFFEGFVRYKEINHLFYDNDREQTIQVDSDKGNIIIATSNISGIDFSYYAVPKRIPESVVMSYKIRDLVLDDGGTIYDINRNGETKLTQRGSRNENSPYKKYDFKNVDSFTSSFRTFLLPPFGSNLFSVVDKSESLKEEFGRLFRQQGLDFVLSRDEQLFELQRKNGYYVIKYPFFSIADTFRRFMFYVTAIESNKNSVIIFEEPEVHSFPPYVKTMAHRIASSEENQFFISTHSPYLLQTLIDELDDSELAVHIAYYEDYQTHIRILTTDELQEARDLSIDLFYNLSRYEPNA